MTRAKRRALGAILPLAGLACLVSPRPSFAWGNVGHETIALIAQDRLSRAARAAIGAILGDGVGLDRIATCADAVKRAPVNCPGVGYLPMDDSTKDWHYIDIATTEDPDTVSLESDCAGQNCVVDQINSHLAVLAAPVDGDNPSGSFGRKKALMFVVHLVGDEHMPLHCAVDNDDAGGNSKVVSFSLSGRDEAAFSVAQQAPAEADSQGTPGKHMETSGMNLHHLWDNIIETDQAGHAINPRDLASRIEGLSANDACVGGDLVACAARESFRIAKDTIYRDYYQNDPDANNPKVPYRLGQAYQNEMQPIAYAQIELAGAHLASLLEKALGGLPAATGGFLAPRLSAEKQDGISTKARRAVLSAP